MAVADLRRPHDLKALAYRHRLATLNAAREPNACQQCFTASAPTSDDATSASILAGSLVKQHRAHESPDVIRLNAIARALDRDVCALDLMARWQISGRHELLAPLDRIGLLFGKAVLLAIAERLADIVQRVNQFFSFAGVIEKWLSVPFHARSFVKWCSKPLHPK